MYIYTAVCIHTEAMARDDLYYCFFFVLLAKGMTSYGPTTTVVKAINDPSGPTIVWNLCPVKTHNNSSLSILRRPTPNPFSQSPHPLLRQRPSSTFSHRFSTSHHTPQPWSIRMTLTLGLPSNNLLPRKLFLHRGRRHRLVFPPRALPYNHHRYITTPTPCTTSVHHRPQNSFIGLPDYNHRVAYVYGYYNRPTVIKILLFFRSNHER